jgi:hypothetical protein
MPNYLPVCHESFRHFFKLVIVGILKRGSPASSAPVALGAQAQRTVTAVQPPLERHRVE